MTQAFDTPRAARAVAELLEAAGLDVTSASLRATPARVAGTFAELFRGIGVDPASVLQDALPVETGTHTGEVVVLRDIAFRSVCEHHLLPFHGRASVAYAPGDRLVGLSALAKLVHLLAARPQIQERLGEDIASALMAHLSAAGALVVLTARHGCVSDRGVSERDAQAITIAAQGTLAEPARRAELMHLFGSDA